MLNSNPKTWLVACFAVSILVGFVPSIYTFSQVQGHDGDEIKTKSLLPGTLKCETGSTNGAKLEIRNDAMFIFPPDGVSPGEVQVLMSQDWT